MHAFDQATLPHFHHLPDYCRQVFETPIVEETQLLDKSMATPWPYLPSLSSENCPPRPCAAKTSRFCAMLLLLGLSSLGWRLISGTSVHRRTVTHNWAWHGESAEPIKFSLSALKTKKHSVNQQVCNSFDTKENLKKSWRTLLIKVMSNLKVWGN